MSTLAPVLLDRPLGQFPISIATSLALEGLFGIHEEHPVASNRPRPWVGYDFLHINVRTLIRNCYQSLPSGDAQLIPAKHFAKIVAEEISIINTVIADNITDENFTVAYFFASYENLARAFPRAVLKGVSTDKQKHYASIEDQVIELLLKDSILNTIIYEKVQLRTQLGNGKALMLSHYPVDVLVAKHKRFSILESHTGYIKQKHELTNKIKSKWDMPFDIMTIQLFGDTANMFKPAELKVRQVMYKLAQKYHWNSTTTEEKIKFNVKHNEPFLYEYICDLYKAPKV